MMPLSTVSSVCSDIAIVGLSCRFPGDAASPSAFWDLLKDGRSGYSESTDRYNAEAFHHPQTHGTRQNVIPVKGGYFLKQDPYVFDAAFFNITATEAVALDPRQRIAMEVAYEALENAGMPLQRVRGTQTACFLGVSMSDYRDAVSRDFGNFPKYQILGVSDEMIANRISHFLDIHGPSATVQSACSSSLVATHIACQSLRSGESEMAIAGGVGLITLTDGTMHLNNLGFLNPEGHSRSFDAGAGGYGRGEGCGVVILKRLDDAVRDGDTIRAVIRGSGVNSDGWTQGVTMPSKDAQAALIRQVYQSNGLELGSTQYVEAHGTGTKVGDPIEASAIYGTIGQAASTTRKCLYMGSVKPNIGHLEAAAGIASIIKGVLALERGLIPPNINFAKPNPSIPLDEWKMVVPTKLTPWPTVKTKRMSISGFGMGGTNGHVVMDAYRPPAAINGHTGHGSATHSNQTRLFVLSSHDKAGFQRLGQTLAAHLQKHGAATLSPSYLAHFAYTLAKARSGLVWRTSVLAEHVADLQEKLTATALGDGAMRVPARPSRIGFVFTGQGAQWARMGIELLQRPVFAESVATSTRFLQELGCPWDPITELSREQTTSQLGRPEISQPICTVLQIALVDELLSCGVVPTRVVGHSSGEIAAAYTVGALSHRDALAAAYFRGTASAGLVGKGQAGGMMAVGCSREDMRTLLADAGLMATIACVNSPSNVTVSGDVVALDALKALLDERRIFARRLKVEVAYHSPHMHLCSQEYYNLIADIGQQDLQQQQQRGPPAQATTMVSSVLGYEVDHSQLGPYYWVQNLINPVLFLDALKEMVSPADAEGEETNAVDLLVEVGPHSALGGPAEQILSFHGIKNIDYTSVLVRGQDAIETSMRLAAELFQRGMPGLDVYKVNGDAHCRLLTDLPCYPWNHSERFSAIGRVQREQYTQAFPTKSLLGAMQPTMEERERVWRSFIRLNDEPWLRGHVVGSSSDPTVLFPAAGMVSVVLEAAQQMVEAGKTPLSFKMRDVSFLAAMPVPEGTATEMTVHIRPHDLVTSGSTPPTWWAFTVSSCAGPTGQLRDNCRGLISIVYADGRSSYMIREDAAVNASHIADYRRILDESPDTCAPDHFYDRWRKSFMPYGEAFRGVVKVHPGRGKTCYQVQVVDIGDTFTRGKLERPFLISPATLDAAWQGVLSSSYRDPRRGEKTDPNEFGFDKLLLPTFIGEMVISTNIAAASIGTTMHGCCRSRQHGLNEISANISLLDESLSNLVMSVSDFRMSQVEMGDAGELTQDGEVQEVDPANITSVVRWNYALDVLEPSEISQAMTAQHHSSILPQFVQMVMHQRPAAQVVELVPSHANLSDTVISQLPAGMIYPIQAHYAAFQGSEDGATARVDGEHLSGQQQQLLTLRTLDDDAPPPATRVCADLFVLPYYEVAWTHDEEHELGGSILKRLFRAVTPADGAWLAVEVPSALSDGAKSALREHHFEIIASILTGAGCLLVCRYRSHANGGEPPSGNLTRSVPVSHESITVLVPAGPSSELQAFRQHLHGLLEKRGYSVVTKIGVAAADPKMDRLCISLFELDGPLLDTLSETDFESLRDLWTGCERLLWVTCGENPSLGMVDGLARCVNVEVAGAKFQVLHLSSKTGMQSGPELVARILDSSKTTGDDNEFRELRGLLQVPRMHKSVEEDDHLRHHLEDATRYVSMENHDAHFRLAIGKPGLLNTLHFVRQEKEEEEVPLADNELELDVQCSGLNFRDVMVSMGLVPATELGQEASGVVLRAGLRAAEHFQPGDRVSALSAGGAHATKIRCDYRVTVPIPESMSFEEAAATPMTHTTAYYALVKLAKLRRGQSVLIHAAAGGVGQAAIQLAIHLGLVVYVTVSTVDKRRLLMTQYGVPEEHIFHSRDTSFAKGIQRITSGRGVDCVLNSLSGELLRESWACLSTFGTFVELGLRDIADNSRLEMRQFKKSVSFTYFDIRTMITEDPATLGEAFNDVFKLLQKGTLRVAHPLTTYPVSQIEDAFRTMQQGKHRGKILLSFRREDKARGPVLCQAKDALRLDATATYLIVGGLGGLGRSLARELVASGARHIAFVSRSGCDRPEAKATMEELSALGAKVRAFRGDVADQGSFLAAMDQCAQQLPPIKGVVQMAMVLRDVLIENMTYEEWSVPLGPKVRGTWNLHQYFSHERPIDFMIFCSSFSGLCGSPGQAQYGAGNTYQDALANHRRAQGLNAVSVNLGIMLDVGILAEMGDHTFKLWEDVLGIREHAFHALMKSLINAQWQRRSGGHKGLASYPAQVCLGLGTADILAAHRLPDVPWFSDPRFGPLTVKTSAFPSNDANRENGLLSGSDSASLASHLAEAGSQEDFAAAASLITVALVGKIAEILRIPVSEVDARRPMYSYGVDSLVALEVRNWITREMKANMALLDILSPVPMETFADQIAHKSRLVLGPG